MFRSRLQPPPPARPRGAAIEPSHERRARTLTSASGLTTLSAMPDLLPTSMPAAVYQGKGAITVETVPVPAAGTGRGAPRGQPLRGLRQRPALRARGLGPAGPIGGHEYTGRSPPSATASTGWEVGRRGRRRARPAVRRVRVLPGRAPVALHDAHGPDSATHGWQGAFARYVVPGRGRALPHPDRPRAAPRRAHRAARGRAARHHARAATRPGERGSSPAPGPSALLGIAALRALGIDDVTVSEPRRRRRRLARDVGAHHRGHTRRARDARRSRRPSSTSRSTSVLECSGNGRAMEAGLGAAEARGTLVLVGAGIDAPRFDPNRILLNELVITGAFIYDADGFDARARAARVRPPAPTTCSSSRTTSRSTSSSTPCTGWRDGELAAKVHGGDRRS